MPGDDDDGLDFDDERTKLDTIPPIPEAVPEKASTGKYRTLTGFEKAAAREISGARDRLYGRDEVFTAYRLWLMSVGSHPDAAGARMQSFRAWMNRNEELVAAAMKTR